MPRQSKDVAAAHWIRDAGIAHRAEKGETHSDIAKAMGMTVAAVGVALSRHKKKGRKATPAEVIKKRLDRAQRKRALDADGTTYHARGQILKADERKFNAMVDRAKPAVDRVLKGESDERDGKDNQ